MKIVTLKLLLLIACALALLLWAQRPLLKKRAVWMPFLLFLAETILATAVSMLIMVSNANFIRNSFAEFLALYAALFAAAAGNLLFGVVRLIRRKAAKPIPYGCAAALSAFFALALLIGGTWNARHTTVKEYSVESAKVSEPYTIAFVSDVHFGHTVDAEKLTSDVELLNSMAPDCVILGGDITDDCSTKENMEEAYRILSALSCDTYYVYGNHDRQAYAARSGAEFYTEAELRNAIERAGIRILKDETAELTDSIVLLGREDASREDRRAPEELPTVPLNAFLVVADHQPYETEDILACGAQVQLSGHSHAGQLFPNGMLYSLLGYDQYGAYDVGGTKLFVSAGEGGCGELFRTDGHSEILTLTILPQGSD